MAIYDPTNASILQFEDTQEQVLEHNVEVPDSNLNGTIHIVKDGETLHSISRRYYGTSEYWFRIGELNNIVNPFTEVVAGLKLIIP